MGRSNFDATRPEFWVHKIIGDDGDRFVPQRQQAATANQLCVPQVIRVHRHGFVAQHRLRAGSGDDQELIRRGLAFIVEERIFDMPKVAFLLDHLDFFIGEGRARSGVPIHHAFAAIDHPFLVEIDKHTLHAT